MHNMRLLFFFYSGKSFVIHSCERFSCLFFFGTISLLFFSASTNESIERLNRWSLANVSACSRARIHSFIHSQYWYTIYRSVFFAKKSHLSLAYHFIRMEYIQHIFICMHIIVSVGAKIVGTHIGRMLTNLQMPNMVQVAQCNSVRFDDAIRMHKNGSNFFASCNSHSSAH